MHHYLLLPFIFHWTDSNQTFRDAFVTLFAAFLNIVCSAQLFNFVICCYLILVFFALLLTMSLVYLMPGTYSTIWISLINPYFIYLLNLLWGALYTEVNAHLIRISISRMNFINQARSLFYCALSCLHIYNLRSKFILYISWFLIHNAMLFM